MTFPTLQDQTKITDSQKRILRQLTRVISELVNSSEFEELIELNGWSSKWGHCRVASEALQILAWEVADAYLTTMNFKDGNFSHWFLMDPESGDVYDPTSFQFGGDDVSEIYQSAVARGIQSRIRNSPYTRSPATLMLIDVVNESVS
jgi:hypothetical protein